jgi:adenylosuccinate synthase
VTGAVCAGAGVGPSKVGAVIGVMKAYCTRVGAGPFPTELNDATGQRLRDRGHEYGTTTGRPRRCGWLDLAAVKYAAEICGLTEIAITKLDVLDGLPNISVGVGYELDGRAIDCIPANAAVYEKYAPVYREMPGWSGSVAGARRLEDLPREAREYLDYIEMYLNLPIRLISVGPGREETIVLTEPFA